MNAPRPDSENQKLSESLQSARPTPALPPRFGEHVWRRIEATSDLTTSTSSRNWLEMVATLVLQPRVAFAMAAMLVVAGLLLGARGGVDLDRKNAQTRYVTAVVPHVLH